MKVLSLPEELDKQLLVDAMLDRQFMVLHCLSVAETLLISESRENFKTLETALPGVKLVSRKMDFGVRDLRCLIVFTTEENSCAIDNLYLLFPNSDSKVFVSFVPVNKGCVLRSRLKAEEAMSNKEVGLTKSTGTRSIAYSETDTKHMELYHGSDEREVLIGMLDSLKASMLANGTAYKITIMIDADLDEIYSYIKSKMLIVEERSLHVLNLVDLYEKIRRIDAIPFDNKRAACLLGFSNSIKRNQIIRLTGAISSGDVLLGNYLDGSARETCNGVSINKETLNLGTLVSGVPGTGKTFAAMHIIGEVIKIGKLPVAIISPSEEWNAFGKEKGFHVIKLYESKVPFNFFKCDSEINIESFYENLAMLLAEALDAGPYTGPLEKCLLSAFRKLYGRTKAPDPVKAYYEIEEAVIEQHAKRSNVGVKYTKHGENIRASLENLRQMLNRPEFAYTEGINFEEILRAGVVFDLSKISNKLKPFFYALLLNQIYSFAESFDVEGDRRLRVLICLEEAQLVLGREDRSAATADLAQRIQNFRKKGIGLLLVTHSITDIDQRIRRLCQTKLYFRQSADVTKYASEDLLFEEKDKEALVEKLKMLEQGVCALNCIEEIEGKRLPASSLFIRIPHIDANTRMKNKPILCENRLLEKASMTIKVTDKEGVAKIGVRMQVFYLGEKICENITDDAGTFIVENTLKDKEYLGLLLGERKKDSKKFKLVGGRPNIARE